MEGGVHRVVRIGLLGFGTVGSSVYDLIQEQRAEILEATGVELQVARILERDLSIDRPGVPQDLFTDDFNAVSYTHLRAHETDSYLVCRLLLDKKNTNLIDQL